LDKEYKEATAADAPAAESKEALKAEKVDKAPVSVTKLNQTAAVKTTKVKNDAEKDKTAQVEKKA